MLDIEGRLEGFGGWLRTRLGRRRSVAREHVPAKTQDREAQSGHVPAETVSTEAAPSDVAARERFIEGFVTASLVFCVGPLTILGSLSDGLGRGADQLILKAALDGFASISFAAALGVGVMASVVAIVVVQGSVLVGDALARGAARIHHCDWRAAPAWASERTLHESGVIETALEQLDVYEHDGALWLRTTAYGLDKDSVLRRSNGEWTYFATDIAYHLHKIERAYDHAIDVWGADHHGHIARMRAAWQALGGNPEAFEVVLMQLVSLTEGGERVKMSKRAGTIETLDDLLDDIGVDAARWFLASRSHDTTLDVDLELARSESQDNPVYYVQYAHARIASILRKAGEERVEQALAADLRASSEHFHPSARALVKRLLELPGAIRDAAERRAPHRITSYATETAQDFSAFYRDCRVVGAAEEGGDEDVRIAIAVLTKRVLAQSLDLLGVEAPEQM